MVRCGNAHGPCSEARIGPAEADSPHRERLCDRHWCDETRRPATARRCDVWPIGGRRGGRVTRSGPSFGAVGTGFATGVVRRGTTARARRGESDLAAPTGHDTDGDGTCAHGAQLAARRALRV